MAQWEELIYDSIYLDGRDTVTGQGSETDVSFEGPTGSSLTEIVSGQEYVDVREYDRISVRVDAAINGGSDDVTVNAFSRLVEEASRENPASVTVTAGSSDYLVQSLDASNIGYLRVTHDAAGSDHRLTLLAQ